MNRGIRLGVLGITLAAVLGLMVSAARAGPTVNYYLTTVNATATGGTWELYADVSRDNDGLANFGLTLYAAGGVSFTTRPIIETPDPTDPSGQYAGGNSVLMGFNSIGSSGVGPGTAVQIYAAQSPQYIGEMSGDIPYLDMGILVGVGQEDSSASPQNGAQGPIDGSGKPTGIATPVWGYMPFGYYDGGNGFYYAVAGTLIAQGEYALDGESTASISVEQGPLLGETEVLQTGGPVDFGGLNYPGVYPGGDNVPWGLDPYQSGYLADAMGDNSSIVLVPEPASVSMVGIFGAGMMMRRRGRGRGRGKC